jgi:hypothetical protein
MLIAAQRHIAKSRWSPERYKLGARTIMSTAEADKAWADGSRGPSPKKAAWQIPHPRKTALILGVREPESEEC